EPGTLAALQRQAAGAGQSLRDLLLGEELLTPWQVATILEGNLADLMVGDLRVLDVARVTAFEQWQQVFSPDHGIALLRTLYPRSDTGRLAEYRSGFHAASRIQSPHVVATHAILDLNGTPGVLQEWIASLPGSDWHGFAHHPAVWLRLLEQTARGLARIHEAGLVHGHLEESRLLLTRGGRLCITGLGEPRWLVDTAHAEHLTSTTWGDLQALGRIGGTWLVGAPSLRLRSASSAPLHEVVDALADSEPRDWASSAEALAHHLAHLRRQLGPDEAPWHRLVALIGERLDAKASANLPKRRSA
ncbi:MAG TPA: hypothetical protein PKD86_05820, partial [Gemmatales bacterium]|nr:hypothetical protein [Gemmatales bacterium]